MAEVTPEEWRPVVGFDNYEVSDRGLVYSKPRPRARGGLLAIRPSTRYGYPEVGLFRDGRKYTRLVHVLVAEAFHGPRQPGMEVRHKDGDGSNCWATNLEWGTHQQNIQDSVRHGTHRNKYSGRNECDDGHALVPRPNGRWRHCPVCRNRNRKVWRAERRRKGLRVR